MSITRTINSQASLRGNPDVNSQGQIDEDGEGEEVGTENPAVNESGGHPDLDEADDTPAVLSATVFHNGAYTDINIRVATATGAQNKRLVIPRHFTAKKLAAAIANVANW